jgi:hypothetical protein
MRDGLFLLRESMHFPGDFTLCVCYEGVVQHYRVETTPSGKMTIDQARSLSSGPDPVSACFGLSGSPLRFLCSECLLAVFPGDIL